MTTSYKYRMALMSGDDVMEHKQIPGTLAACKVFALQEFAKRRATLSADSVELRDDIGRLVFWFPRREIH